MFGRPTFTLLGGRRMKLAIRMLTALVAASLFCGLTFAADLTDAQKHTIDRFLVEKGLNSYGDPMGTMYAGGTPLFDERTGRTADRFEYLIAKFPGILDGTVGIQPVDGVARVESAARLVNEIDAKRLTDRYLNALVDLEAENARLIESIRAAVDAHDYRAIRELLSVIGRMDSERVRVFVPALRDTRRMLQAPTIQPVDLTSQVAEILRTTETLIRRARG